MNPQLDGIEAIAGTYIFGLRARACVVRCPFNILLP